MKLHYYEETDSLYIDLSDKESAEAKEVASGVILDFDENGGIVGIDIDHASQKLDLKSLDVQALPVFAVNRRVRWE